MGVPSLTEGASVMRLLSDITSEDRTGAKEPRTRGARVYLCALTRNYSLLNLRRQQ